MRAVDERDGKVTAPGGTVVVAQHSSVSLNTVVDDEEDAS